MAKKMKIDGKTYSISHLAWMIEEGKLKIEEMKTTPAAVLAAVKKMLKKTENEGETFYGSVKRETEKAVLFSVANYMGQESIGGMEIWLPKSKTQILLRANGPMDAVIIPSWLAKAKFAAA